jgi:hypothetical protein
MANSEHAHSGASASTIKGSLLAILQAQTEPVARPPQIDPHQSVDALKSGHSIEGTHAKHAWLGVTSPVGTDRLVDACVIAGPVLSDVRSAIRAFPLLPGASL